MDIQRILAQLHEERRQVNEVIQILERLAQGIERRKDLPTAMSLQGIESGKRKRTASPVTRVKSTQEQKKLGVKAKAAGN
jgi:hypothetical protein